MALLSGAASLLYALLNLMPRRDASRGLTADGRPSDGLLLHQIARRALARRHGQPIHPPATTLAPDLRAALGVAALAASRCGAYEIGTAHLLLGILHDREGVPARLLAALGVTVEEVDAAIQARGVAVAPAAARPAPATIGLAAEARETVRYALAEASRLRYAQVSSAAVLLALARQPDSAAGQALHVLGLSAENMMERIALLHERSSVAGSPSIESAEAET